MDCVWYSEAFHSIGVAPLLEMALEGSPAPVTVISANLTFIFDAKPVEFV